MIKRFSGQKLLTNLQKNKSLYLKPSNGTGKMQTLEYLLCQTDVESIDFSLFNENDLEEILEMIYAYVSDLDDYDEFYETDELEELEEQIMLNRYDALIKINIGNPIFEMDNLFDAAAILNSSKLSKSYRFNENEVIFI